VNGIWHETRICNRCWSLPWLAFFNPEILTRILWFPSFTVLHVPKFPKLSPISLPISSQFPTPHVVRHAWQSPLKCPRNSLFNFSSPIARFPFSTFIHPIWCTLPHTHICFVVLLASKVFSIHFSQISFFKGPSQIFDSQLRVVALSADLGIESSPQFQFSLRHHFRRMLIDRASISDFRRLFWEG
jgi:hypothetical protein